MCIWGPSLPATQCSSCVQIINFINIWCYCCNNKMNMKYEIIWNTNKILYKLIQNKYKNNDNDYCWFYILYLYIIRIYYVKLSLGWHSSIQLVQKVVPRRALMIIMNFTFIIIIIIMCLWVRYIAYIHTHWTIK